jgi:hypothetical protein
VTSRVFDCHRQLVLPTPDPPSRPAPRARGKGFKAATFAALVLVPLAGAAEPPHGWTAGTLAALTVLLLAPMLGSGAPWGWFAVLTAGLAVVTPRGQVAAVGPALFVATALCLVLWFANRSTGRRTDADRPRPGSAAREAQLVMGQTGERHVGSVLARELPDEFVLINGLKLPRGAGDIDHLVIGPTGVFLLETKTMAGRIECDEQGHWRRTRRGRAGSVYPAYIGNPSAQVQRNIFATRQCLRRRMPSLFFGTALWIEGLVVFPHPRTELLTEHSRVPAVRLEHAVARICSHAPQRALAPAEVDEAVAALLDDGQQGGQRVVSSRHSAQALVETALVLPLVLVLLFGTVALSRLVQAQTAIIAVAHESARAGALARSPDDAVDRMRRRMELVAAGLGLDSRALSFDWDVSRFAAVRGQVMTTVRYTVDLHDLPLLGWTASPTVQAQHVEWVDPFRSGVMPTAGDGP